MRHLVLPIGLDLYKKKIEFKIHLKYIKREKRLYTHRFDIEMQNMFHIRWQLVDNGEISEHRASVSDDNGPHTWCTQNSQPWHVAWLLLRCG